MGLVARVVEEFGVPTVTVSTGRDITALVRPPRSLFVNFPMGNSFGMAGNTEMQTKILREALDLAVTATEPGVLSFAVRDVFEEIRRSTDREYLLRVSMCEIYNEVVRDLLADQVDVSDAQAPYTYVIHGLTLARSHGIEFDESILTRGLGFLGRHFLIERNLHQAAFIAYALAPHHEDPRLPEAKKVEAHLTTLFEARADLNHLSRAYLALALHESGRDEEARLVVENMEDYGQRDAEASLSVAIPKRARNREGEREEGVGFINHLHLWYS